MEKKLGDWEYVDVPVLGVTDEGPAIVSTLRTRRHRAGPGSYPWDYWEGLASEAGVSRELATIGRAVMREADQHGWDDELQRECGWSDAGEAMIELARSNPAEARRRWEHLLATDGERIFLDLEDQVDLADQAPCLRGDCDCLTDRLVGIRVTTPSAESGPARTPAMASSPAVAASDASWRAVHATKTLSSRPVNRTETCATTHQ
jgi:hypothetical protein